MKFVLWTARIVAVIALLVLAAPFGWEKTTGDYLMTVTGESMRPTYEIGDVLVVQKPTGTELSTADQIVVVSFTPGNKAEQYVHRVHEITDRGTILKGDGNKVADPSPVQENQVMGTPRAVLSGPAAIVFHLTQNLFGRIALVALALPALFLTTRDKPRGRRRAAETTSDDAAAAAPAAADEPTLAELLDRAGATR